MKADIIGPISWFILIALFTILTKYLVIYNHRFIYATNLPIYIACFGLY